MKPPSPEPIARKPATYQDVLDAPPDMVAELLGGELFLMPRPGRRHTSFASLLGIDLGAPFQRGRGGPGGWVFLDEPELHLFADVVVPDLAGWRAERAPEVNDEAAYTSAPDWVCEVISPRTEKVDRGRKMRVYAAAGVKHVWLANPAVPALEVYRASEEHWLQVNVFTESVPVRAEPFDAIELDLGALWTPAPQEPATPGT